MNAFSMILRVVAVAAGIAAAVGWFLVQGKLDEKTAELEQTSADARSARNTLSDIQGNIATLESQLRTRDAEIAEEKSRSSRLNTQLLQARRDVGTQQEEATAAKSRVSSLEDTIRTLRTELVSVRTQAPTDAAQAPADAETRARVTELTRELESARSRISRLEGDLESAKQAAKSAEAQASRATSTATTSRPRTTPTGTTPTGTTPAMPTSGGTINIPTTASPTPQIAVEPIPTGLISTIASVDRSAGLVALNSGTGEGVQRGQVIILRDGFSDLARVQIAESRENVSVARILPDSRNPGALRAGNPIELVQ